MAFKVLKFSLLKDYTANTGCFAYSFISYLSAFSDIKNQNYPSGHNILHFFFKLKKLKREEVEIKVQNQNFDNKMEDI